MLANFKKIIELRNIMIKQEDVTLFLKPLLLPTQDKKISIEKLHYSVYNLADLEV